MSNAERIYGIAVNHALTVQVCIDRLHELGANAQLKLLTGRLQKLAVQATPADNDKGTKAPRRQQGRPQNSRGQPAKGASWSRVQLATARTRGGDTPRQFSQMPPSCFRPHRRAAVFSGYPGPAAGALSRRKRRQRNCSPAPENFFANRLSQKGYPLYGQNHFWTGFCQRGHD
jgi:hypothetical protein